MTEWLFFGLIFASSFIMTWGIRNYALHKGLMDIPNTRSSHVVPTPRGGGLSFVVVPVIAAIIIYLSAYKDNYGPWMELGALLAGGVWIALIGLWDDHQHIPARWRLLAHSIAAFGIVGLIGTPEIRIADWTLQPTWVSFIIFAIALVWLLNLFNFMDGIDGLAGVEVISVAGSAIFLLWWNDTGISTTVYWLGTVMAGVAGFLVWNWPPAKIFMGDVGSGFLGFFLGAVAIITAKNGDLSIWSWIILMGVFIVDATVTLIRRIMQREIWYEAHRSHTYQRLTRRWNSHLWVTLSVLLVNICWLLPLAWWAQNIQESGAIITVIAFIPLIYLALSSFELESDSI